MAIHGIKTQPNVTYFEKIVAAKATVNSLTTCHEAGAALDFPSSLVFLLMVFNVGVNVYEVTKSRWALKNAPSDSVILKNT